MQGVPIRKGGEELHAYQTDGSYHYQFKNSQSDDVDAINNFWGAGMNNSTIDASVHDDEEGSCEVTFYPFETNPAPCAPAPTQAGPSAFTAADAVIALEIAVVSHPPDLCYDVSGDGRVTSLDALMILKAAGGVSEDYHGVCLMSGTPACSKRFLRHGI